MFTFNSHISHFCSCHPIFPPSLVPSYTKYCSIWNKLWLNKWLGFGIEFIFSFKRLGALTPSHPFSLTIFLKMTSLSENPWQKVVFSFFAKPICPVSRHLGDLLLYKRPCSLEQDTSLRQPTTLQCAKLKVHLSTVILVQVHYCSSPVEYRTSLLADLSDKSEGGKRKGDKLV